MVQRRSSSRLNGNCMRIRRLNRFVPMEVRLLRLRVVCLMAAGRMEEGLGRRTCSEAPGMRSNRLRTRTCRPKRRRLRLGSAAARPSCAERTERGQYARSRAEPGSEIVRRQSLNGPIFVPGPEKYTRTWHESGCSFCPFRPGESELRGTTNLLSPASFYRGYRGPRLRCLGGGPQLQRPAFGNRGSRAWLSTAARIVVGDAASSMTLLSFRPSRRTHG